VARALNSAQRAALDSLLSAFTIDWLQEWAAFALGLFAGAALSHRSVDVGLAVIGLPLAWVAAGLSARRPTLGPGLFLGLLSLGVLTGLLAAA
jgi:hypothetical protein